MGVHGKTLNTKYWCKFWQAGQASGLSEMMAPKPYWRLALRFLQVDLSVKPEGRVGRKRVDNFFKKLVPTADMPCPNTPEGQGFVALHTDETTEIQAQYEDI